jgi:hypothetical protein
MQKEFGYEQVFGVKGGYDGWMVKWTPSGRKRPPKGKFVATGRESLKSGLDLDPEVAATYEENWGNPEASFAAYSNQLKKDDYKQTSRRAYCKFNLNTLSFFYVVYDFSRCVHKS